MSAKTQNMNCYILAGGKSSRMGTDKGILEINGKKIISYVIDIVKPLFKKTIIVSTNKDYADFGLEMIEDKIKNVGPAGGIYTALSHSQTEQNFILSCDMPFVTTKSIEYVAENSVEKDVTVPIYKNKIEPMFAVYATKCVDDWKKAIDENVLKLQNIMYRLQTKEINCDVNILFNDDVFFNINSKEDLKLAENKIKHGN